MFASRERKPTVDLAPGQERVFRLPPMSEGPVVVKVHDADFTTGPHGEQIPHTGLASDLQVTLFRPNLELSDANSVMATSLWQDAYWRLKLRRNDASSGSTDPWRYLVSLQYPTQLPVVDRSVPAFFFQRGFDENWNRQGADEQGYILVQPDAGVLRVYVEHEFGHEYGLGQGDGGTWNTLDAAHFPLEMADFTASPIVLSVGAGPLFQGGPTSLFVSARVTFPAGGKIITPTSLPDIDVGEFTAAIRMYLYAAGGGLAVAPSLDAPEIFSLIDSIPTVDAAEVKRSIETGLTQKLLGVAAHIQPWLVGGPHELWGLTYELGPGETPDANGIIEPATGRLIVQYVGPKVVYQGDPVISDGGSSGGVADASEPLFTREELRDEEPEPLPGQRPGTETPLDNLDPVARAMRLKAIRNWKTSIGRLNDIEHIVVLMQENRSFDNMLGYLSREGGRTDVDGLNSLPPDPATNPQVNRFKGLNYFPQRETTTAWPSTDMHGPGHDLEDVTAQMQDGMGGFVTDWASKVGENSPYLQLVMNYFGPDQVTEYAKLAEEFAICERWFCSFPGPTWPNRFTFLSGDLSEHEDRVEIHNPDLRTMTPRQEPILLDFLSERPGVEWLVFEHGYSFPRIYGKHTFETSRIRPFDDPNVGFEAVARTGLPQVTFIEPDYIEVPPGNDDHAPADVADGQELVRRIMRALVSSPSWDKTLFVITYDEHGGFYDHVPPPYDAVPLRSGERKLGPRVPAFVVSPYVARRTVLRTTFDHTSIGATIVRRFCGPNVPHVSDRMAAAKDLQEAITLDTPRPASDFAMFGSAAGATSGVTVRSREFRRQRIGRPESPGDFHWFLNALRMVTGSP
jgi:phospholipase C